MISGWHIVGSTLRDGRPIPADGKTLRHKGPLKICYSGLHASERLIDAIKYSSGFGTVICRVRLSGQILFDQNKFCASERTILWRVEGADLLRNFARACALDVIHFWNPPEVVREYLETGDEGIRQRAASVALDTLRTTVGDVAKNAARSAVGAATQNVIRAAAWSALGNPAQDLWNAALVDMTTAARLKTN